jgi:hypothetical protein
MMNLALTAKKIEGIVDCSTPTHLYGIFPADPSSEQRLLGIFNVPLRRRSCLPALRGSL